jgi:hypothetical protein
MCVKTMKTQSTAKKRQLDVVVVAELDVAHEPRLRLHDWHFHLQQH